MKATTDRQKAASKANSLKSTGPKTAAGKSRSRGNALKHGMTGEGVCIAEEDPKALQARFDGLADSFSPQDVPELVLTERAAMLAVRLARSRVKEAAMLNQAVRDAIRDHDAKLMSDVFAAAHQLHIDPAGSVWKLKQTAQGVDWMIERWQELRDCLTCRKSFGPNELILAEQLQGRTHYAIGQSRIQALSNAIHGEFTGLEANCWDSLKREEEVKAECRVELDMVLGLKIQRLREHRETLNLANAELDRREAPLRAVVDLSPAGQLFRRYEGAAAREFHKIVEYFDAKKAEAAPEILDATPAEVETSEAPASFGGPVESEAVTPVIGTPPVTENEAETVVTGASDVDPTVSEPHLRE